MYVYLLSTLSIEQNVNMFFSYNTLHNLSVFIQTTLVSSYRQPVLYLLISFARTNTFILFNIVWLCACRAKYPNQERNSLNIQEYL